MLSNVPHDLLRALADVAEARIARVEKRILLLADYYRTR